MALRHAREIGFEAVEQLVEGIGRCPVRSMFPAEHNHYIIRNGAELPDLKRGMAFVVYYIWSAIGVVTYLEMLVLRVPVRVPARRALFPVPDFEI